MNWKFWKKKKSQEDVLRDMRIAEEIRLMNVIQQNAKDGKPETENYVILKELNYHATLDTEDAKKETERSNRRSKIEKTAATISPFVVMGCAVWNAKKDSNDENVNRTDGGKRITRMLDGVATKFTDIKNSFKK